MIEEKHIRQVSQKKIETYSKDVFNKILEYMKTQDAYYNDVEQVVALVQLQSIIGEMVKGYVSPENIKIIEQIIKEK